MRISAALAAVFLITLNAHAGRLDLFVLQFPDARDVNEVSAALEGADLVKITNSDNTETKIPALRGGSVVFVQSIGVSGNGKFGNSTRLSDERADVSGSLSGSNLSVEIAIEEGVNIGLRKFRRSVYAGSGSVAGGVPRIISVKQGKGRSQIAIKGDAKLTTYGYTTMLIAQYTP